MFSSPGEHQNSGPDPEQIDSLKLPSVTALNDDAGRFPVSVDEDSQRFDQIIKGKVRDELRKYISSGEILTKKGKDTVSIPIPHIDLPRFKYSDGEDGEGNGNGSGKKPGREGEGSNGAGEGTGDHALEVEMTIEELMEALGDSLKLPRIEPKGKQDISLPSERYTDISHTGPESLRHFKRSFREALKRQVAEGTYNPEDPVIVPEREDLRYKATKLNPRPEYNAVIFHVMDVSGSMGTEQKEIARSISFWTDTWISSHYKNTENVYIIHDDHAQEVDREKFFRTKESGGTKISSSYEMALNIIEARYPPDRWNIYVFQYTDGDNLSSSDNERCCEMLRERLLPKVNLFAYGQIRSGHGGSGTFMNDIEKGFKEDERVVMSRVEDKKSIPDVIKKFLSTGR